jgi:hypothetical protein
MAAFAASSLSSIRWLGEADEEGQAAGVKFRIWRRRISPVAGTLQLRASWSCLARIIATCFREWAPRTPSRDWT